MKKILAGLAVIAVLAAGTMAFAHGYGGWGGGHMRGPGYGGGHMMGQGHMGFRGGPGYGADTEFLKETKDLRKELHNKKFEYFEAARNPETNTKDLAELEKEIYDLRSKLAEKAPQTFGRGSGGYGYCW